MILDDIIALRRQDLERSRGAVPRSLMEKIIAAKPPARDFRAALRQEGTVSVIAEIKRASPTKGDLRPDLDPRWLGPVYEAHGAAAISVLTETRHFKGSMNDLAQVHSLTTIPTLRKDFIVDEYQILEARSRNADALLLIVAALSQVELEHFLRLTEMLGLQALVEIHTVEEAERALAAEATIIGINNRDLNTFTVDLNTTERLLGYLPQGLTVVSESGIKSGADVRRVGEWGAHAVLVGEAIVSAADPGAALQELVEAGKTLHAR